MKLKVKDWSIVYTSGSKHCEVLAFSSKLNDVYWWTCTKDELIGYDDDGIAFQPVLVPATVYNTLYEHLLRRFGLVCGPLWVQDEYTIPHNDPIAPSSLVSKEMVLQGIKGLLSPTDLATISYGKELEKGAYFLPDAFIEGIQRYLKGEATLEYTKNWLFLLMSALYSTSYRNGSKKEQICEDLAYFIDGQLFFIEDEGVRCAREILSEFKESAHAFAHTHLKNIPPMRTNDRFVVYTCFSYCNGSNEFHKICVIDEKTKTFQITYIINPDYLEDVNYNSLDEYDFDYLPNRLYQNYYQDIHMDLTPFIHQCPYIPFEEHIRILEDVERKITNYNT